MVICRDVRRIRAALGYDARPPDDARIARYYYNHQLSLIS